MIALGTFKPNARMVILIGCFAISSVLFYFVVIAKKVDNKNDTATLSQAHSQITEAIIHTDAGDIGISFDKAKAPMAADNFITLAEKGFFDGTLFHRAQAGLFIQGGDPFTRGEDTRRYGTGGPGYIVPDEFNDLPMYAGAVAMANSGPGTAGSQFFILAADAAGLFGKYTVFAHVSRGLPLVADISGRSADLDGFPEKPVRINSVELK